MTRRAPHAGAPTATVTLGDLLYADKSKARVPEEEWVHIVRAIAAGDQSALRALYERSHLLAFTLIMRITNDRETSEELTLDVFHDVWRKASQYDAANGTVLGWIMNQARSRAIDRLRYQHRQKRTDRHLADPSPSVANDCGESIDRAVIMRRLRKAVAMLAPDERAAIEAAYFAGLTHAEISAQLGEPLGTIKTRIRSGLRRLRLDFDSGKDTN